MTPEKSPAKSTTKCLQNSHKHVVKNGVANPLCGKKGTTVCSKAFLGNGRNTVSRALFRKRELTEFFAKLVEFYKKLGEFALAHKQ